MFVMVATLNSKQMLQNSRVYVALEGDLLTLHGELMALHRSLRLDASVSLLHVRSKVDQGNDLVEQLSSMVGRGILCQRL